ncbi:hypothetical protein, partial [Salmonella sp. s51228]|uniref:hypothetical protein n=1 Tax=Salmonella sp. s51228 TaxID=3159652 RepID=UPI00397EE52B
PDTIREIQFVNGKGELKTVSPQVESDLFYASGVSVGLFGIVVSVSIEVVPTFNVKGTEENFHFSQSLLMPGKLIPTLKVVPYFHCNWLPQSGVNVVSQFSASKN